MKTRPRKLLIGGIALVAGIGLGNWAGHRNSDRSGEKKLADPVRSGGSNAAARPRLAVIEEPHDLRALLKWRLRSQQGFGEDAARLERMDKTEIRDLMRGLLADLAVQDPSAGGTAVYSVRDSLQAAGRELFRREGEEALRWADKAETGKAREELLGAMLLGAVADAPSIAKPWLDRFSIEFGKSMHFNFAAAAGRGAIARGAEDLVGLGDILGKELTPYVPYGAIPEGFNYPLMMEKFRAGEPEMREAMQLWAARDQEAAWAEVRKVSAKDSFQGALYVGAVFSGLAVGGKEREAIRWIIPKLDELPADSRSRALGSLFADNFTSRVALPEIMQEFSREDDRIAVAEGMIRPGGDTAFALAVLRAAGGEAAQKRVILTTVASYGGSSFGEPGAPPTKNSDFYSGLMDQLGFSDSSRMEVESKLRQE